MLEVIFEVVGWILAELVLPTFGRLVLLPVAWLVSLPFILVIAAFRSQPYFREVGMMLWNVTDFWRGNGWLSIP